MTGPGTVKTALLRLRFASLQQLRAHLHVEDNATLLFFRDPRLDLPPGTVALVEIVFDTSEETRVVRTTTLARAEGLGLWLAMPNARFAREVKERGLVARRGRRVGSDRYLRLKRPSGSEFMVTLLDVSLGGARIGGGLPSQLSPGDHVDLRLASPDLGEPAEVGRACVAWVEAGEAGLAFDRSDSACRSAVAKLFQASEARWRTAREVRHPDSCCRGVALMEPPVPRVRIDGKRAVAAEK
jgi:hypothetical protein